MIKIADLITTLSDYMTAKLELAKCRRIATGDVEYYCSDYSQKLDLAERALAKALNGYIDQRVAEAIKQPGPSVP